MNEEIEEHVEWLIEHADHIAAVSARGEDITLVKRLRRCGEFLAALAQQPQGEAVATAADAAAFIERKAEEYARDFGYSDMGSLSFGSGDHAQVKMDHYTSLQELADEIRALAAPAPSASPAALTDEQIARVRSLWLDPEKCEEQHASSYNSALEDALDALLAASPADQVEDARRLDWMAEAKAELRLTVRDDYMLCIGSKAIRTGKTPRDAIDAAMSASKEGNGNG